MKSQSSILSFLISLYICSSLSQNPDSIMRPSKSMCRDKWYQCKQSYPDEQKPKSSYCYNEIFEKYDCPIKAAYRKNSNPTSNVKIRKVEGQRSEEDENESQNLGPSQNFRSRDAESAISTSRENVRPSIELCRGKWNECMNGDPDLPKPKGIVCYNYVYKKYNCPVKSSKLKNSNPNTNSQKDRQMEETVDPRETEAQETRRPNRPTSSREEQPKYNSRELETPTVPRTAVRPLTDQEVAEGQDGGYTSGERKVASDLTNSKYNKQKEKGTGGYKTVDDIRTRDKTTRKNEQLFVKEDLISIEEEDVEEDELEGRMQKGIPSKNSNVKTKKNSPQKFTANKKSGKFTMKDQVFGTTNKVLQNQKLLK